MKLAFDEYHQEVIKPALAWLSRHWKGYIALVAIVYGLMIAGWMCWWYSNEISEFFRKLKTKFTKKKEAA